MPLQEFWNEDPDLLWVYRNSYINKIEQEIKYEKETTNFKAWLEGLYNYNAIICALSSNGRKYFDKPIDLEKKAESKVDLAIKIKNQLSNARQFYSKGVN